MRLYCEAFESLPCVKGSDIFNAARSTQRTIRSELDTAICSRQCAAVEQGKINRLL